MLGERTPDGKVQTVLATGKDMLTRPTTQAAGFLPKGSRSPHWMTTMAWLVSRLETSGSWTTCWSLKSELLGVNVDHVGMRSCLYVIQELLT